VPDLIRSFESLFHQCKSSAEKALDQLNDDQLNSRTAVGNSVATICWHIAGNLESRFTDFLTSDGEKPGRDRESEFAERRVTRAELNAKWDPAWKTLLDALAGLTDAQRQTMITIRSEPYTVEGALLRALAHVSLHVGQIIDRAHMLRGDDWKWITIPPGQSDAVNAKLMKK
jgi:uncharacterized damage-inducible protein DinB